MFELECRRYLSEAGLLENLKERHAVSVAAYILCSVIAIPVRTVIVAERPYSTDIHPLISSAMSYDPSRSRPTPSTVGVASDLHRSLGCKYIEVERYFRDSWKYLNSGTVVVNCTLFTSYSSSHSMRETVPFQRWLRSMVECTALVSPSKIDIVCMGVPALNVVDLMLRSMGEARGVVRKKTYPNPAIWARAGKRDARSLDYTFEKKGTSQSILEAIARSRDLTSLKEEDYLRKMSSKAPSQVPQVGNLIEKAGTFVNELEEAYKELESNHRPVPLRSAYEEFSRALVEYRDSILCDIVSSSIAASGDNSSKIGRSTEWGSKKQWKKPPPSVGNSSKMSVLSEDDGGIEQKFEEEAAAGELLPSSKDTSTEAHKPKKRVVVKRVVRKAKKAESAEPEGPQGPETTVKGDKIGNEGMSALRSVIYYVSEMNTDSSTALRDDISASIDEGVARTATVGTIVDTAARDTLSTGKDASTSLGLADGTVSDECILPRLLNKLASP